MKITNQFKSLFKKKDNRSQSYNEVLNEILEDTFKKKKDLHIQYYYLVQKVWESNKGNIYKTYIVKYILSRLSRESDRIFLKASILAHKLCPNCASKNYSSKKIKQSAEVYNIQSTSLH